jgi:hypothetical protein
MGNKLATAPHHAVPPVDVVSGLPTWLLRPAAVNDVPWLAAYCQVPLLQVHLHQDMSKGYRLFFDLFCNSTRIETTSPSDQAISPSQPSRATDHYCGPPKVSVWGDSRRNPTVHVNLACPYMHGYGPHLPPRGLVHLQSTGSRASRRDLRVASLTPLF